MSKRARRRGPPIHPSIKESLGYDPAESDDEVYEDWKGRTSRVCKPCWELKYCPYGPLVEQLPTLPPLRSDVESQHLYFKSCLETDTVGSIEPLTEEWRLMYEEWIEDVIFQAAHLPREFLLELGVDRFRFHLSLAMPQPTARLTSAASPASARASSCPES